MMTETLATLWLSGSVQRWHCNPVLARSGQTLADHQGRCVLLLLALHPAPSAALIFAAATHDVGEIAVGDLPLDFKRGFPDVAARHAEAEHIARRALCGPPKALTGDDLIWLKLLDQLEAHCWCLHRAPFEYERPAAGWMAAEPALFDRAAQLGVDAAVRGLIWDMKSGAW